MMFVCFCLLFAFETEDPASVHGPNWPQTHSNTPSSSSQIQRSQLRAIMPRTDADINFQRNLTSTPVWSESSWNIKGFSFRDWVPGAHGKEENRTFCVRPCSKCCWEVSQPCSHSKPLQSDTGSNHGWSLSKPSRENHHSPRPTQDTWKHSGT